jgi:hypothetical protein
MSGRSRKRGRLAGLAVSLAMVFRATQAFAQHLGSGPDVDVPWWRLLAVLGLCLVLAAAAIYVARSRRSGAGPPRWPANLAEAAKLLSPPDRRLRLIETVRLSHQTDVCLIACDGAEFIVAASPQGGFVISAPSGWPGVKAS